MNTSQTDDTQVPQGLTEVGEVMGRALGRPPASEVFSLAIALYFMIDGFLYGYIVTRLYLQGAFVRADHQLLGAMAKLNASIDIHILRSLKQGDRVDKKTVALAEKVRKVPLERLQSVNDIAAWGKAQAILGNYDDALTAYNKALEKRPNDSDLILEQAALKALGIPCVRLRPEIQMAQESWRD